MKNLVRVIAFILLAQSAFAEWVEVPKEERQDYIQAIMLKSAAIKDCYLQVGESLYYLEIYLPYSGKIYIDNTLAQPVLLYVNEHNKVRHSMYVYTTPDFYELTQIHWIRSDYIRVNNGTLAKPKMDYDWVEKYSRVCKINKEN